MLPGGGSGGCRYRAHSSIINTLNLLEMSALVVETTDHRLTAEAVNAALDEDPDVSDVAAVVCTSGTTNAGIIDDLAGVGEIAKQRGWWFHVDGAYGGSGIFARSLRESTPVSSRRTPSSSTRTSGSALLAVR
jgi:glutamate/tyrosine decarboxylase-like PLP-dependent enzyme